MWRGLGGWRSTATPSIIWLFYETRGVKLRLRPWGRGDFPEVGIFATRFTQRPNPIALSIVKIVEVDPPRLKVLGLDAWSGSPVLDIKPYDHLDVVNEFRTPDWFEEFFKETRGGLPR